MPRLILGFFVLLFLVGAGYFVATHNRTTTPDVATTVTAVENPATERGTLRALLGLGESSQCTFTSTLADGNTNVGTIFAADGRVKVDSVITDSEGVQTLNFIDDGTFYYSWGTNPEGTFAVKMPRQENTLDDTTDYPTTDDDLSNEPDTLFDYEQEMQYECSPWRVDEAQFVPPTDIEFVDMTAMMEAMFEGMAEFDPTMLEELESMMQTQ